MKHFYKKFFLLMIPMCLKNLIASLLNLIDTIMVGQLGEVSIAAVGIANQVYSLYYAFLVGISGGAGIFTAQFWGTHNVKGVKKALGSNLALSLGISFLFTLMLSLFPTQIIKLFSSDPAVIREGVPYLRIVCFSYIAMAVTFAFDMSLCCSEQPTLPFFIRFTGLIIKIVLNWILISGNLRCFALGLNGAAIATVIARFAELLIMLIFVYGKKMVQAAPFKELFSFSKSFVLQFSKISLPIILNEILWSFGVVLYSWVFARISTEALIVVTIVQNIEKLLLVFFHGGGSASGIIIGQSIGLKKFNEAYSYAKKLITLMPSIATVIAILVIFLRKLTLIPYNISSEVYQQAMHLLIVTAILIIMKSVTYLLIVGAFRNGGDTQAAFFIDTGCLWFVGLPLVAIGGLLLHLPLLPTYILMCSEEVAKLVISLIYFRKKKWIKNISLELN